MIEKREPDRPARMRDTAGVAAALRAGARDALERHKKLGESIVICRDDRVVEVPPDQIDAELERAEREAGLR